MKKQWVSVAILICFAFLLTGCNAVSDKTTNMSFVYATTAFLSLFLLVGYCFLVKKKELWFLLLFASLFIVNIGYFSLAISQTLEEALLANRISYLGSVFLPMSMLMIILHSTDLNIKKWLPGLLLGISIFVFFVAATPGYLDIYYKEVSLEIINGVTTLNKTYGPWHNLYYIYLLLYFAVMVASIIQASCKKRLPSRTHAVLLLSAVLVNIGVWLLGQTVKINFEFLSVSYIMSGLFLLGLCLLKQENEKEKYNNEESHPHPISDNMPQDNITEEVPPQGTLKRDEKMEDFMWGLSDLTHTERVIYDLYLRGCSTKEIMAECNIKENTLKYHNKNIYSKLGVSSRKQLLEIARKLPTNKR